MEVVIQPNAAAAADLVAWFIAEELRTRPAPVLGLATGRTMEAVYARLAQMHRIDGLDFSACRTFNLDEYLGISAEDRHSYRHYMNLHLFNKVNIDLRNTHLPNGTSVDPGAECARYERLIADSGGIDLQLLGIGSNGHLGFNEPLSPFTSRTCVVTLARETIQQNARFFGGAAHMPRQAITMGLGTILASRGCILLATGADKASIVARAIEGPITSMIPATSLQTHPDSIVVLDEAATGELKHLASYRAGVEGEASRRKMRRCSVS